MQIRPLAVPYDLVALAIKVAEAPSFAPGDAGAALPRTDAAASAAPGWLERLDRWLWRQQQRDLEASLAGATDLCDLERRLRAIERGVGARYY